MMLPGAQGGRGFGGAGGRGGAEGGGEGGGGGGEGGAASKRLLGSAVQFVPGMIIDCMQGWI